MGFPTDRLDLTNCLPPGAVREGEPRVLYQLYATICHFGPCSVDGRQLTIAGNAESGHYTSTVKNGEMWVDVSDECVTSSPRLDARMQTNNASVRRGLNLGLN